MIVRCGRCRAELEVAGAGEFICPQCGTRNVVRGESPALDPYGIPDLLGRQPADPEVPDPAADMIRWVTCPGCAYRFVLGRDVAALSCPNCLQGLVIDEHGARLAPSS